MVSFRIGSVERRWTGGTNADEDSFLNDPWENVREYFPTSQPERELVWNPFRRNGANLERRWTESRFSPGFEPATSLIGGSMRRAQISMVKDPYLDFSDDDVELRPRRNVFRGFVRLLHRR
mmetsp:Transcript_5443/g.23140  ORF Transcript_5443/g.23140 Transcript_5443/m.23140 type:complete len:121 (+) Transcript_5443:118-480(+)